MTKKSKKLGVKITKSTDVDTSSEVNKTENNENSSSGSHEEDSSSNSKTEEVKNIDLDKLCSTLDKLSLDVLILMQQQMRQKLNIEKNMTDGELHLSKSRYIMGHKNVSTLQLPTENSPDIDPSVFVEEVHDDESMFGQPRLQLKTEDYTKPNDQSETEKNVPDPTKWFGVLVPRDLKSAQAKFKEALDWVVDCANTQIRLHQTCVKIKQLKEIKKQLKESNEE